MKIIKLDDRRYPKQLLKIKNPPKELYVMGDESILNNKCVAIVGSRNMSEYGREVTKKIVKDLTLAGICIVSGMAVGADTVAHKETIKNRGKTIAVLPCGLNNIYPKKYF